MKPIRSAQFHFSQPITMEDLAISGRMTPRCARAAKQKWGHSWLREKANGAWFYGFYTDIDPGSGHWPQSTVQYHQLAVMLWRHKSDKFSTSEKINLAIAHGSHDMTERQTLHCALWSIKCIDHERVLILVKSSLEVYECPTGKNTCFHQHAPYKSAFMPKISVHIQCKWMTYRPRKWSNRSKGGKMIKVGKKGPQNENLFLKKGQKIVQLAIKD